MNEKKSVSFVIPCYRSAVTLPAVIDEILRQMQRKEQYYDYEIVCAVDGSPDSVFDVLKKLGEGNRNIKAIDLSKNYGQANARMAAMYRAKGDYIVGLDDDGQCPVDRVYDLLDKLEDGFDVAVARYPRKKQSLFKNFGSKVNKLSSHLLLDIPRDFEMSNFFAMKRFVMVQLLQYTNPYPYLTGLISQITRKIAMVPMEERARAVGETGYTLRKLLHHWLNGFTSFSIKPLRMAGVLGFLTAMLGFCMGFYYVIRKLLGFPMVSGYTSIIAILLFVGGVIMILLGIIGEYVGRIFICINNSPQYVIRETVNVDEQ